MWNEGEQKRNCFRNGKLVFADKIGQCSMIRFSASEGGEFGSRSFQLEIEPGAKNIFQKSEVFLIYHWLTVLYNHLLSG